LAPYGSNQASLPHLPGSTAAPPCQRFFGSLTCRTVEWRDAASSAFPAGWTDSYHPISERYHYASAGAVDLFWS